MNMNLDFHSALTPFYYPDSQKMFSYWLKLQLGECRNVPRWNKIDPHQDNGLVKKALLTQH